MIISIPSVFPLSLCYAARCCGDGVHISHFVCESTSHFPSFSFFRAAFVFQIDFPSAIQREQSNRKKYANLSKQEHKLLFIMHKSCLLVALAMAMAVAVAVATASHCFCWRSLFFHIVFTH